MEDVISLYQQYIRFLLTPVKTNRALATKRDELKRVRESRLFEIVQNQQLQEYKLEFTDFTLASWPFVFIYALYSIAQIQIGIMLADKLAQDGYLPAIFSSSDFQQKVFLFSTLLKVVFFPLSAWVFVKFWRVIIGFFASLFDKDLSEVDLESTISSSLVGNFFLIIPIFGEFLKFFAQVLYLYFGIRYNMRFTFIQSVFIITSPLILIVALLLFMIMYVALIINFL